jgi:hypothetical protein
VTPSAHASTSPESDSVYLWNYPKSYDAYGNPGITTWYRVRTYFPSNGYAPTTGEWNWIIGHHNDSGYQSFACSRELANVNFDVTTDYPVVAGAIGQHPRLKMRVMGGATCSPQTTWYDLGALKLDHWYDILYEVTWRPDSGGQVNMWLDGSQLAAYRGPTLYARPDGSVSYTNFDIVNYRLHAPWNSTIYFTDVKIGSSSSSVQ